MIQLVSDTVLDDIITKRGYTPTIVRDLAARYRELATYACRLEEALAYFEAGVAGYPKAEFVDFMLTPELVAGHARNAIQAHEDAMAQNAEKHAP